MGNFFKFVTADRRLMILKILEQDAGYSMNAYVIQSCLSAVAHEVSMDRLKTDLAWLEEQGLVVLKTVSGLHVAQLTIRGTDAANGRIVVPGIKRPLPGD